MLQRIVRPRRSMLYLPLSNLKMVGKAGSLGSDTVCFDLEDGVAPEHKEAARTNWASAVFSAPSSSSSSSATSTSSSSQSSSLSSSVSSPMAKIRAAPEKAVRINAVGSGIEQEDIRAVLDSDNFPEAIVLPKVEHPDHLKWLADRIAVLTRAAHKHRPVTVIGMIESAVALTRLESIFSAARGVCSAFIFGGDDYAASIGATRTVGNAELQFARGLFLVFCKAHGMQAIDIVKIDLSPAGEEAFVRECEDSARAGFDGKQVIHPKQVAPANRIYAPSAEHVAWAHGVVAEAEKSAAGAFVFQGKMIDKPTVLQAREVIARAAFFGM